LANSWLARKASFRTRNASHVPETAMRRRNAA
jgi:hypothetical protein